MYVKQIVEKVQDDNFMVVLHNCGNTGHCTEAMLEVGAMGYHFGNDAYMVEVLKQCPTNVLIMGNLNPVGDFTFQSPKGVRIVTKNLLEETKEYKNFVISTGCDTPPNVPLENIEAFYDEVKKYNKARE